MSARPDRDELLALVTGRGLTGLDGFPNAVVTYARGASPDGWLLDGDIEGSIADHRAAHATGRPSEAALRYGAGTDAERVVGRLLALGDLARETGLLRAVCPVPGEGSDRRPGSWGVEDLGAVRAARRALPGGVWVRPHWRLLGPAACQVAVAFGANDWQLPDDDAVDPHHLATAVGARAVER
ncbi:MAG: hypothetical protein ACR2N6_02200 [Miltoncostaeaceae bacterium]